MHRRARRSAQPLGRKVRAMVPTSRDTVVVFGLTAGCLLAGWLAISVVIGTAMFQPLSLVLAYSAVALSAGSALCFFAAARTPALWLLWPILFGGPTLLFGINAGFSPPDPRGLLLWRSIAVVFLLVPTLAAFWGSRVALRPNTSFERTREG